MSRISQITSEINEFAGTKVSLNGLYFEGSGMFVGLISGDFIELTNAMKFIKIENDIFILKDENSSSNEAYKKYFVTIPVEFLNGVKHSSFCRCTHCECDFLASSFFNGTFIACPNCSKAVVVGMHYVDQFVPNSLSNEVSSTASSKININENLLLPLKNLVFVSDDHRRYVNQVWTGRNNKGAKRIIKITSDKSYSDSFIVSIFLDNELHPHFGDNFSVSPKRMKVLSVNENKVVLQGYGVDPMLSNRPAQIQSNFACDVHFEEGEVKYISYYFLDRDVRLDYFK
jgi:hypothetical protein